MQPPNNNNSEFPAYNEPLPPLAHQTSPTGTPQPEGGAYPGGIPSPGGYPPAGNYPTPQRGPEVSFDTITDAWNLFTKSPGPWIGGAILYIVLILAPWFIVQIIANMATANINPQDPFGSFPWALFGAAYIWTIFCSMFLHLGYTKMATNHVRTGRASLGDMFAGFGVLPAYLGAAILVGLAACVGACLCLVPAFIVGGLTMLTFPLIVDQRMGAMQAIQTSWNALRPHMWMATLYLFVIYLILAAGGACYIGVLVTMPLFYLSIACVYRDFFLGKSETPGQNPQSWAPIADPGA